MHKSVERWTRLAQALDELPEEKYGDVQVILWILQIAMGYWTDNPDALRIAQEVRQKRLLLSVVSQIDGPLVNLFEGPPGECCSTVSHYHSYSLPLSNTSRAGHQMR
jgi:hypothetical protein